MATVPTKGEFRHPVFYLRRSVTADAQDDFDRSTPKEFLVAVGQMALREKTGVEVVADSGLNTIERYEAWDRWDDRPHAADVIQTRTGERYHIESRLNYNSENRWAKMTVVKLG